MDELQAGPRKLELQASHIQQLIDRGHRSEDKTGGNVDDDSEEDSDILDVGDCLWGKTAVKRLCTKRFEPDRFCSFISVINSAST